MKKPSHYPPSANARPQDDRNGVHPKRIRHLRVPPTFSFVPGLLQVAKVLAEVAGPQEWNTNLRHGGDLRNVGGTSGAESPKVAPTENSCLQHTLPLYSLPRFPKRLLPNDHRALS